MRPSKSLVIGSVFCTLWGSGLIVVTGCSSTQDSSMSRSGSATRLQMSDAVLGDSSRASPAHESNDSPAPTRVSRPAKTRPAVTAAAADASPSSAAFQSMFQARQAALEVLMHAAESPHPQLRANAIEALHADPARLEPIVRRALGDENRGVRFVAAMTVGKLKMTTIAPLLEPMLHDDSLSVQAAAIYGLRSCGRMVNPTPLASMLRSEDPEVKGNAAMVVGELGDASALPMLQNAVGKGLALAAPARAKIVDMQLAEAMVRLGNDKQIVPIRAALFAPAEQGEIIALACQICGRLKDGGAIPDLSNLVNRTGNSERPAEVRMAAAMALAQIDPSKTLMEVPLAYLNREEYQLRAQAAVTLGLVGDSTAIEPLYKLLSDQNPVVQTAAAGGILQIDHRINSSRVTDRNQFGRLSR